MIDLGLTIPILLQKPMPIN